MIHCGMGLFMYLISVTIIGNIRVILVISCLQNWNACKRKANCYNSYILILVYSCTTFFSFELTTTLGKEIGHIYNNKKYEVGSKRHVLLCVCKKQEHNKFLSVPITILLSRSFQNRKHIM